MRSRRAIRGGLVLTVLTGIALSPVVRPPEAERLVAPPPGGPTAADPVSLSSGLYVRRTTDLVVQDVMPIQLERVYLSNDTRSVAFGVGITHSYDYELTGSLAAITVVTDERSRIPYKRIDGGMARDGAQYEHWATRSHYWGSVLGWLGDRWGLVLSNGTRLLFRSCGTRAAPNGRCTLIGVLDAAGNQLSLLRDEEGRLLRIETPNRRWLRLQYDAASRITRASDSDGAHVGYEYDDRGHLIRAVRSGGSVHTYDYDARGLMVRMKDVPGMAVENEYDADRRATRQVITYEPDTAGKTRPPDVFAFRYVVNDGRIMETEVVMPRGERHRLTFDAAGYTTREVWTYPDARSTMIDYAIETAPYRVTSVLVSCNTGAGATTSLTARVTPGMSPERIAKVLSAQCGVPVRDPEDDR